MQNKIQKHIKVCGIAHKEKNKIVVKTYVFINGFLYYGVVKTKKLN